MFPAQTRLGGAVFPPVYLVYLVYLELVAQNRILENVQGKFNLNIRFTKFDIHIKLGTFDISIKLTSLNKYITEPIDIILHLLMPAKTRFWFFTCLQAGITLYPGENTKLLRQVLKRQL